MNLSQIKKAVFGGVAAGLVAFAGAASADQPNRKQCRIPENFNNFFNHCCSLESYPYKRDERKDLYRFYSGNQCPERGGNDKSSTQDNPDTEPPSEQPRDNPTEGGGETGGGDTGGGDEGGGDEGGGDDRDDDRDGGPGDGGGPQASVKRSLIIGPRFA